MNLISMTHRSIATFTLRNKYRSCGTSSRSLRSRSELASASEKVTDPNTSLYLDTFRNISGAELIKRSLECKIKAARTSSVGVDEEDTRREDERETEKADWKINAYTCSRAERTGVHYVTHNHETNYSRFEYYKSAFEIRVKHFQLFFLQTWGNSGGFLAIIGRTGDPWYSPTYDRWHSQIDDRRGTRDQ